MSALNEKKVIKETVDELIKHQQYAMESIPATTVSETRRHVSNTLVILYALRTYLRKKK